MALVCLCAASSACELIPGAAPEPEPARRPNVLLIIADDLGYADIGAYGSEIATPNVDRLAREGVQFTNFHVAATCSPTRSMLLSGVDNHLNGLGNMAMFTTANQRGQPGYEGFLNDRVAVVSELLADAGYDTYFAGKWHLGMEPDRWPAARGFARSYALLDGSADNYSDMGPAPVLPLATFVEGTRKVERGTQFSSTLYTDKLLAYIGEERSAATPFFAVLSFQAVHWPHHAPAAYIDKYVETYAAGWDELREARFERQKRLGLVRADLPASPPAARVPSWRELGEPRRALEARRMAAYAGMTEHMDHEIGRVLEHLSALGVYDDTMILFVSDNGPDASEPNLSPRARPWYAHHYPDTSIEGMGAAGSFPSYGPQWAQLGTAYLRDFKGSSAEGGLRVPLIISHPAAVPAGGRSAAFGFATDIVPTILEAAGVSHPGSQYRGRAIHPLSGRSLSPALEDSSAAIYAADEPVAYELMKSRALYLGDYKLLRNGPPAGNNVWELFDLSSDPSELHDQSQADPERRAQMLSLFDRYLETHGVIPMPDDYDVFKALTSPR
jgi:arylsulfatase